MKVLIVNQQLNMETQPEPGKHPGYIYVVSKVKNSTRPHNFEQLTPEQLDVYCDSDLWDVTIN